MRWGRIALPLALSAASLLPLTTGCGDGGEQRVRITAAISLLPTELPAYREIAEAAAHDHGFEVEVRMLQYEDIRRALEAEVAGGRGTLDVVEADVFDLAAIARSVRALPEPATLTFLNSFAVEAGVIDGERRFLPHRLAWQALIVNTEAVPFPPATWEDLLRVAEEHSGAIGLKADAYEGLTCDLLPFLWQAGGDPLHPENPANAAALRFLQRLAPHLNPAAQGYREGSILQAQELGEIVLHQNWPFAVPQLREAGLLPGRMCTAPLPAGPAGQATLLGGGYLAVSRVANHPDEAALFVEAMTRAEVQRQLVERLGWFPVREDGWDSMSEADRADFAGFIAMAEYVRPRPVREDYPDISALWQEAFERAVLRGEDAETTLADIASRMPTD
ncbi:extracellular solute-binding protein [Candidatus Sumerlaeota bacterium]|nr:extracellular solute-binding protein [Candidatus Sumerlaeota bacterium]